MYIRAVYRNFAEGGRIWGMDKIGGGGAEWKLNGAWYREVLHSR